MMKNAGRKYGRLWRCLVLCLGVETIGACGGIVDNSTPPDPNATGGQGAIGTGGSSSGGAPVGGGSAVGGYAAAGGAVTSGGAPATGGASSSGGAPATGGASSSGGNWSGGLPPLHTERNLIKDPAGNKVILRGVAIADLFDVDTERPGMTVADLLRLLSSEENDFYARVIRLTVLPERYLADPETYLVRHLIPAVERATELGLYVIVDWHEISDVEPVANRTTEFWRTVAPLFANQSNVLYELFNEPVNAEDPNWEVWWKYASSWVQDIRTVAQENIILVGGPFWSQRIEGAIQLPIESQNIVYVGHIYSIIDPYTWSWGGPFAQVAAVYPLMITEWGFRNDGNEIWDGTWNSFGWPVKDFIEYYGLSWTAWCADSEYGPNMFDSDFRLLTGEGEMGQFARDWLLERKDEDQSGGAP